MGQALNFSTCQLCISGTWAVGQETSAVIISADLTCFAGQGFAWRTSAWHHHRSIPFSQIFSSLFSFNVSLDKIGNTLDLALSHRHSRTNFLLHSLAQKVFALNFLNLLCGLIWGRTPSLLFCGLILSLIALWRPLKGLNQIFSYMLAHFSIWDLTFKSETTGKTKFCQLRLILSKIVNWEEHMISRVLHIRHIYVVY